jgi:hypothetical protein
MATGEADKGTERKAGKARKAIERLDWPTEFLRCSRLRPPTFPKATNPSTGS